MNEQDAGVFAEKIAQMLFTDSLGDKYKILQQVDNGQYGLQLGWDYVVNNIRRILSEG